MGGLIEEGDFFKFLKSKFCAYHACCSVTVNTTMLIIYDKDCFDKLQGDWQKKTKY